MTNNKMRIFARGLMALALFMLAACCVSLPAQEAQEPQEAQEAQIPKTRGMLYVDDLAKLLLKEDMDELGKVAVALKRQASIRLHFVTGNLKLGTEIDGISTKLATISGVGVEDGDNDMEALFTVMGSKLDPEVKTDVRIVPGKAIGDAMERVGSQKIAEELRPVLQSEDSSAEARSKAILLAYSKLAALLAKDAGGGLEGIDGRIEGILMELGGILKQSGAGKKEEGQDRSVAVKSLGGAMRDPGVPPPYDDVVAPRPDHKMYVCDWGDLLAPADRAYIDALGTRLDDLSTAELVIVTVPTIDDGNLDLYALDLARTWGIGKKDKNNGCLLFVVKDRLLAKQRGKITIQVGYGLEGCLNDSKCGRILDDIALPPFLMESHTKEEGSQALRDAYEYLAMEIAREYGADLGIRKDFYPQLPKLPDSPGPFYDLAGILTPEDKEFLEDVSAQLQEKANAALLLVTIEDDMGVDPDNLLDELQVRDGLLGGEKKGALLFSKGSLAQGSPQFGMMPADESIEGTLSGSKQNRIIDKVIRPRLEGDSPDEAAMSSAVRDAYICAARLVAEAEGAKLELPKGTIDLKDFEASTFTVVFALVLVFVVACFVSPQLLIIFLPVLLIVQLFMLPFPKGRKKVKEFWKDVNKSSSGGGGSYHSHSSSGRSYSSRSHSSSRSSSRSYGGGGFGGGGASR